MIKPCLGGRKPARILFIQTAYLGDVVFSTALLHAVAEYCPEAGIHLLASPRGGGIIKEESVIDELILYDKAGKERGIRHLFRLVRMIRDRRYDLVVSPHRSFRSALIAFFSGAKVRLGFLSGPGGWAYNCGAPYPAGEKRVYRAEMKLAEALFGTLSGMRRPRLHPGRVSLMNVRDFLKKEGVGKGDTLVALVTGTVWPTKKWPVERFQELAGRLARSGTAKVIAVGGPGDEADGASVAAAGGGVNSSGRTNLAEMVALLSLCDVVVACDTGPLHAAMALDVPVVALFGPTDEGQFDFGTLDRCLTEDLDCRPCTPHGSLKCPTGNWRCMPDIQASDVEENVRALLAGTVG